MGINLIRELLHRSDSSGSKSTILKPLTWLVSILIGGVILLQKVNTPAWLTVFFCIIVSLAVLIFFFAYIFCLFKDRDALRSEKYSIQKMAIEKGIYGDNITGIHEPDNSKLLSDPKNLSNQSEREE
ncbi:MAG: hypothetical protein JST86_03290 [Bacteroidetes bacterium]|nr:hypothetical protein [Bacteroidota bacterium]